MKSFRFARIVAVTFLLLVVGSPHPDVVKAQSGRKPKRDLPTATDKQKQEQPQKKTELRLPSAADTSAKAKASAEATAASDRSATDKAAPDADEGSLKIATTLISIPVSVLDHSGHYVPFLTLDEFHVYENNVEQEIVEFRAVNTPFHVALLLDTSGSTRFRLEDIQAAAIRFTEQLRDDDKVMVISFDSRVYIECEFTNDRAQIREAIQRTKTGGSTHLYDAVDLAVSERLNQIEGRKAIVLFTDGVDTSSRATSQSTIRLVEEADAVVYPIHYDTDENMPYSGTGGPNIGINIPGWPGGRVPTVGRNPGVDYGYGKVYLQKLAEASGGRLYNADTVSSLDSAFARIAEELRHQYLISYYPTNAAEDGSWRTIRIRVDQADRIVRTRSGYRAKGGPEPEQKKGKRPTLQQRKRK